MTMRRQRAWLRRSSASKSWSRGYAARNCSDADLRDLYARSRALLLPGEEDFGITPVEALASGKPVIALGRGGALETVPPGGGIFYDDASAEGLAEALERFEKLEPRICRSELLRRRPARSLCAVARAAAAGRRGFRDHAGGSAGERQAGDRTGPRRSPRNGSARRRHFL